MRRPLLAAMIVRAHPDRPWRTEVLARRRLSGDTFEIELARPGGFEFVAGQHIRLLMPEGARDYSLTNGIADRPLALCVRRIPEGTVSRRLETLSAGAPLDFLGPFGHFVHRPSEAAAVWVAAGTGIAPFVSMARSGISCALLLHGAREAGELHYADVLRAAASLYVPCLSHPAAGREPAFAGRVTKFLAERLVAGHYDFYLCGGATMIHEALMLVDLRFPGSRVFSEAFY
ncbi:MAG: FAD-dependent oxidoreductase [Candidatus Eisenbacteria bacterium]